MAGQIFALVVGIQRYANVPNLQGPERDMRYVFSYLQGKLNVPRDHLIPLLDHGATYQGLTQGFERLISMTGEGDTALFYFSGHGGRMRTAPEFDHISGDGYDETLICFDSRGDGKPELADKELAWYISRLNEKGTDVVVFLDCCHAGGMHRTSGKGAIKQVDPVESPRSIASYKGNWTPGEKNDLPDRKFIMLSACNRDQLAREFGNDSKGADKQNRGVFTLALEEVLEEGAEISYSELFAGIRFATLSYNKRQTPQLSMNGGFDPHLKFLSQERAANRPLFEVSYQVDEEKTGWQLEIGAAAGLTPGEVYTIKVISNEGAFICEARITDIELISSWIEPSDPIALDPEKTYRVELIDLQIDPLVFSVIGGDAEVSALLVVWQNHNYPLAFLSAKDAPSKYQIKAAQGAFQLIHQDSQTILLDEPLDSLYEAIKQVCDWEGLANVNSPLSAETGQLDYQIQINPLASERNFVGTPGVTSSRAPGKEFQRYRLFLNNKSKHPLYWYLLVLTNGFGIIPREQDLLPKHSDWSLAHEVNLGPRGMIYSTTDRLKLICSPKPIDVFKLAKKARGATRGRLGKDPGTFILRDWNAENLDFHTYRSLGDLGREDLELGTEGLRFSGHAELRGEIALWSSAPLLEGPASEPVPTTFLKEAGITPIAFLSGEDWHFQLIGLMGATGFTGLSADPWVIQLTGEQWQDKEVWPLAWNGSRVWIPGKPLENGRIAITNIAKGDNSHASKIGEDIRISLFVMSGQNVNLEGLEGPELSQALQQLI